MMVKIGNTQVANEINNLKKNSMHCPAWKCKLKATIYNK